MSKYEFVQEDLGYTIIQKVKIKDKKTGKHNLFRHILDKPVDQPLVEIIEEFGIPIIRLKGKNFNVQYVALVAIRKALKIEDHQKFDYPQKTITWIHPRETITKQEYNAQVGR